MKLIIKIWNIIMYALFVFRGIVKKYVEPSIALLNIVKQLVLDNGEVTDEVIKKLIKQLWPSYYGDVVRYMNAFKQAVINLLPSNLFEDVDLRSFYAIARITIQYLRNQKDSKIMYSYLLMIATKMFTILYSNKNISTSEALWLTQTAYLRLKRNNKV